MSCPGSSMLSAPWRDRCLRIILRPATSACLGCPFLSSRGLLPLPISTWLTFAVLLFCFVWQPPFGGPGTKDDEPVELLPKRELTAPSREAASNQQLQPSPPPANSASAQQPHQYPQLPQHQLVTASQLPPQLGDSVGTTSFAPVLSVANQASSSSAKLMPEAGGVVSAPGHSVGGRTETLACMNVKDSPLLTADATQGPHVAPPVASCAQQDTHAIARAGLMVGEHSAAEIVAVHSETRGPDLIETTPPVMAVNPSYSQCGGVSATCASCSGVSCQKSPKQTGSTTCITVVEVTCRVIVEGEQRTVTFPMDFNHDTPRAVAKEMVDELHMGESEETITDIIRQIELVRLAHTEPSLEALMEARAEPPLEPAGEQPSARLTAQPRMPFMDPSSGSETQHAIVEHMRLSQSHGHALCHLSSDAFDNPQLAAIFPESLASQQPTFSSAPMHAVPPHLAALLAADAPTATDASLHIPLRALVSSGQPAGAIHASSGVSPPALGAGGALASATATDEVEPESERTGHQVFAALRAGEGAPVGMVVGTMPPAPLHLPTTLDLSSPIAALAPSVQASPDPKSPGGIPLFAQGGVCASVSVSTSTASSLHAPGMRAVNGTLAVGNGSGAMNAASSSAQGSMAQSGVGGVGGGDSVDGGSGGSRACALDDDDDGDIDDRAIMQRIEIQQLREIEEIKERHRKHTTRILAMIQRRAQERASRRGADADVA